MQDPGEWYDEVEDGEMDADFVPSDEGDGQDEFDLDDDADDDDEADLNEEEAQDFETIMQRIRRNEGMDLEIEDDDDEEEEDGDGEQEEEDDEGDLVGPPSGGSGRGELDLQPSARSEYQPRLFSRSEPHSPISSLTPASTSTPCPR